MSSKPASAQCSAFSFEVFQALPTRSVRAVPDSNSTVRRPIRPAGFGLSPPLMAAMASWLGPGCREAVTSSSTGLRQPSALLSPWPASLPLMNRVKLLSAVPAKGGLADLRPGRDGDLLAEIARARWGGLRRVAFGIPGPGAALERRAPVRCRWAAGVPPGREWGLGSRQWSCGRHCCPAHGAAAAPAASAGRRAGRFHSAPSSGSARPACLCGRTARR